MKPHDERAGNWHDEPIDRPGERQLPLAAHVPAMPPLARTRVGKSIPVGHPGTHKLAQRMGTSLLLVRYRYDWTGLYRYTTVELLVEALPVSRGHRLQDTFTVRLGKYEGTLKDAVRRHGGAWDPHLMAWTLPGRAVQALGLGDRVEMVQVVDRPRKKTKNKAAAAKTIERLRGSPHRSTAQR
jgi:hypothetical protein